MVLLHLSTKKKLSLMMGRCYSIITKAFPHEGEGGGTALAVTDEVGAVCFTRRCSLISRLGDSFPS